MKKLISLCLALVLMCSVLAMPALAAVEPRGNGYTSFSITYNGKPYTVTVSASYDSGKGARVSATTLAAVYVKLNAPVVEYNTISYGYITDTGTGKAETLTEEVHTLSTDYVPCSKGMSQVINYRSISGYCSVTANGKTYSGSVYQTP